MSLRLPDKWQYRIQCNNIHWVLSLDFQPRGSFLKKLIAQEFSFNGSRESRYLKVVFTTIKIKNNFGPTKELKAIHLSDVIESYTLLPR